MYWWKVSNKQLTPISFCHKTTEWRKLLPNCYWLEIYSFVIIFQYIAIVIIVIHIIIIIIGHHRSWLNVDILRRGVGAILNLGDAEIFRGSPENIYFFK